MGANLQEGVAVNKPVAYTTTDGKEEEGVANEPSPVAEPVCASPPMVAPAHALPPDAAPARLASPALHGRKAAGEYGWEKSEGAWRWGEELHGAASELRGLELGEVRGQSEPTPEWTFHDAYCGIGGSSSGLILAGGRCEGAFDACARAREVFTRRTGVNAQGAWGSFDPEDWKPADVLFSAPPCESVGRFAGKNSERQMWKHLDLVRVHKYKVVVLETLLHFKRMQHGSVFRELVKELDRLGYVASCKSLFAPDFASAAARRRIYLVAVRKDLHAGRGDFVFPEGRSRHHPLSSILEPEFFRRGVRVKSSTFVPLTAPRQRSSLCLRQLGEMKGEGPGRTVYCPTARASAQLATGKGPGWTSGLYLINGVASRLTVREVARLMQISDAVEMDEVEAVAMRHLGYTTPVGVSRGVGVQVQKYLEVQTGVGAQSTKGTSQRPTNLTPEGRPAADARHAARMMAWQACDAAKAAVAAVAAVSCVRLIELSAADRATVERGIQAFHRRRWLYLQKRRGEEEVQKMIAAGVDKATVRRARMTIAKALFMERMRAGNEEGPINLLWWNWSGPVPRELMEGYQLPLRREPPAAFPDNYDTADVSKVWEEFARLSERRYLEGPFDKADGNVYMTHPLAAVSKKGSEKLRIVIDMSITMLNECLVAHRFILPQVQDVADRCYPGCFMITADLQDGFYGVEVRGEDRKYLGLRHPKTGKYYRYTRLAMGAACSPAAFSRLVSWAMRGAYQYEEFKVVDVVVNDSDPNMPRVYGVGGDGAPVATSSWFVDDGCIIAPTRERCVAAYERLVWLLESRLGWRISRRKTRGPAQRITFCGLELDSVGKGVGGPCTRLSEERRGKCLASMREFMAKFRWRNRAPRREMASLVGELSFAANAVPAGRCFLVRMYDAIHEVWADKTGAHADYDRDVPITAEARMDLKWWEQCLEEADCVRLWRSKSFALHRCWSDASNYGFAESIAVNETEEFPQMQFTHGLWPEAVASFSSNWHELATIVHSIKSRFEQVRNSNVHFMTDNTTAVRAVNTGTVRSPPLMALARELKLLQAKGNIGIEAIHLPGAIMMVQGTDQASRSMPWVGMYSGKAGSHDTFAPMDWPRFELNGAILELLAELKTAEADDVSDPKEWFGSAELAGRDTFLHLRPCHVSQALEALLDAQLREGSTTAFTVVAPMVGLQSWRKYLKHFRRKEVHKVKVPGLGEVKHWVLRFEAGDGLLPRGAEGRVGSSGTHGSASGGSRGAGVGAQGQPECGQEHWQSSSRSGGWQQWQQERR